MSNKIYQTATIEQVSDWLNRGLFYLRGDRVFKYTGKELMQRGSTRRRSNHVDPRVDLFCEGFRKSIHVSQLVWMANTRIAIPKGFEIHHRNEDPSDNSWDNLLCVHLTDHSKIHATDLEGVPF